MSFTFNWPRFSDQFHYDAIQMLNTALNKGNKPPIIADKIEVVELEMGTQPPELEIRDIGDLTVDQFRGIFRLTYNGDAHLVLKTKVQANPLNHKQPDIHLMAGSSGMLAAKQPLVVPMLLRLSHFRLSSYVVLVVSKQKGITLVFKTDPLQNVDINSTFDSIAVIQKFIQREIEGQLRQMFREDLPGIIHRLSQQWVKAKVEAPYLNKRPTPPSASAPPTPLGRSHPYETMSQPDLLTHATTTHPHLTRAQSLGLPSIKRPRSVSGASVASSSRRTKPTKEQTVSLDPDYETFDPTYGLRPEGLPPKSVFKGFSSLFTPNKGLADLTEEIDEDDDEDDEEYDEDEDDDDAATTSFDVVEWEDGIPGLNSLPPPTPEYETIPAVGGGTITRPRILHSQSSIQTPQSQTRLENQRSFPPPHHQQQQYQHAPPYYHHSSRPRTPESDIDALSVTDSDFFNPLSPHSTSSFPRHPLSHSHSHSHSHMHTPMTTPHIPLTRLPITPTKRRSSISSMTTTTSTFPLSPSSSTSPTSINHLSTSSHFISTSPNTMSTLHSLNPHININNNNNNNDIPNPKLTALRPTLNNSSIHHLSTLSHSNHTLSPYTRSLSHFTVRSVPPRNGSFGTLSNGVGLGTGLGGRSGSGSGSGSGLGGGLGGLGGGVGGGGLGGRGGGGLVTNASAGYGYGQQGQGGQVKARRKRIFKIGGKKNINLEDPNSNSNSAPGSDGYYDDHDIDSEFMFSGGYRDDTMEYGMPRGYGRGRTQERGRGRLYEQRRGGRGGGSGHGNSGTIPSEFELDDMDRYFRSNEDLSLPLPDSQDDETGNGKDKEVLGQLSTSPTSTSTMAGGGRGGMGTSRPTLSTIQPLSMNSGKRKGYGYTR